MAADDPRVERVARALCQADGKDPDKDITTGRMEVVRTHNTATQREVTEPQWKGYEPEAVRFLAAFDAASL
jgi:hypothetical protein